MREEVSGIALEIRPIRADDDAELATLLELCGEHAEYELVPFAPDGQERRWRGALEQGRLQVFFAEQSSSGGSKREHIVGFAAMSLEYSTWRAESYAHLDCLYLRPVARGRGAGSALLARIVEHARRLGCRQIQWQTPPWNEKAVAFYDAKGASSQPKLRFCLEVDGLEADR